MTTSLEISLAVFFVLLAVHAIRRQVVPFIELFQHWSIAVFIEEKFLVERPPCPPRFPQVTRRKIRVPRALFVADPFLAARGGEYFLFYEILNGRIAKGEIGFSRSKDGVTWEAGGTVLRESFHLSYPYVFSWEGEVYMVPETGSQRAVYLYRAESFPAVWRREATLLEGLPFNDATPFHFNGRWWMLVGVRPFIDDTLHLYSADRLTGPWHPHPKNPVYSGNPLGARPAGRVIETGGKLYRFGQVDAPYYGRDLVVFEITRLTETEYGERPVEKALWELGPAGWPSWMRHGRHHFDALRMEDGRWMMAVDGFHWSVRFNRNRNFWPADYKLWRTK